MAADLQRLADLTTPWCLRVAATLRIAEHLAAGQSEIGALAAAAGADRDALGRVLRHLVAAGVFVEPAPGRFELNDAARGLLSTEARIGLDLDGFGGRMAHAWGTLLAAVRSGRPAYHEAFGRPFWEDLEAHPEISASFDELIGPAGHGEFDPEVLVDPADWASVRQVVDVGGGTGALLAAILRARPGVRGTLVDRPSTVARAAALFRDAGVADRVTAVGGSFFDPLPAGADLYVLKNVIDDWPDAEAAQILGRCAVAARPGGRVVVVLPKPGGGGGPSLLMLVLVGGKSRGADELAALAAPVGLRVRAVGRQPSGRGLVELVPA